jgi:hypothetical protein
VQFDVISADQATNLPVCNRHRTAGAWLETHVVVRQRSLPMLSPCLIVFLDMVAAEQARFHHLNCLAGADAASAAAAATAAARPTRVD